MLPEGLWERPALPYGALPPLLWSATAWCCYHRVGMWCWRQRCWMLGGPAAGTGTPRQGTELQAAATTGTRIQSDHEKKDPL